MKNAISFISACLISLLSFSQCDTLLIPQSGYSIVKTSSVNGSNPGSNTLDGTTNSRWRTTGNGPHEIVVDLGSSYNVTGLGVEARWAGTGKVGEYTVYVTDDTTKWGSGERMDVLKYLENNTKDTLFFGGVNGRYIKLLCESTKDDLQLSEILAFRDTCAASGKKNQAIDFPVIPKKSTKDAPITFTATSTAGTAIQYSIVSGPATVSGNTLTLTQAAGVVKVKATAASTSTHMMAERIQEFIVVDLSTYDPIITTRLVDTFSLEMKSLDLYYPIYINASIDEPGFLSIDKVEVEIEGEKFDAISKSNFYYFPWKPKEFKTYQVKIIALGSNGNQTTITRNVEVVENGTTKMVRTLEDVVIAFNGQNNRKYYGSHKLPQFTGSYKKLVATLDVECPTGGCDPYDRWAHIDIKAPDGNWIQIIRYITPFGIACNHEIDLSPYMSMLQGEVEFYVFIDTWSKGWQFTLDLEYTAGDAPFAYSTIDEVWDGQYDFGNPINLEPVPTASMMGHKNTEWSELILSTSGHGWGNNNTNNAAEFYRAKHDVIKDNKRIYEQDLWNACNPNPDGCNNQAGTWTYDRAGWCPGAISPPDYIVLGADIASTAYTLDYKFLSTYRDLCHPNDPNCQSGVTCPDCNAGYNPHYQVDGQIVTYSNKPLFYKDLEHTVGTKEYINQESGYKLELYPNPSNGRFNVAVEELEGKMNVSVFSINGTQLKRFFFSSQVDLEANEFDLSNLPAGSYFIELKTDKGTAIEKIIIQ
ncbi:MAG: discoidin domain-containing protein [Salibacteraceae bacterium]